MAMFVHRVRHVGGCERVVGHGSQALIHRVDWLKARGGWLVIISIGLIVRIEVSSGRLNAQGIEVCAIHVVLPVLIIMIAWDSGMGRVRGRAVVSGWEIRNWLDMLRSWRHDRHVGAQRVESWASAKFKPEKECVRFHFIYASREKNLPRLIQGTLALATCWGY